MAAGVGIGTRKGTSKGEKGQGARRQDRTGGRRTYWLLGTKKGTKETQPAAASGQTHKKQ